MAQFIQDVGMMIGFLSMSGIWVIVVYTTLEKPRAEDEESCVGRFLSAMVALFFQIGLFYNIYKGNSPTISLILLFLFFVCIRNAEYKSSEKAEGAIRIVR